MPTNHLIHGDWATISPKIRKKYKNVTAEELKAASGQWDQIVDLIQERSGEARREIESFLEQVMDEGREKLEQVTEAARGYASQAAEKVKDVAAEAGETVRDYAYAVGETSQETYDQVWDSVREGYSRAEDMVARRPAETVLVAFGAGLVLGIVGGLILRNR